MKYYISDLHFGHKNVLKFDNRPFDSVEEMNQTILDNWNNTIKNNDDVYLLGDIFWKNDLADEIVSILVLVDYGFELPYLKVTLK